MKYIISFFILVVVFSCTSVEKYNATLETPISPEKLRKDVDYSYKQLQNLHPNLYWYIPRSDLDKKFDSLKTSISTSLKPGEFYEKLAPVIAQVREGHLALIPPDKKLKKKELKKLENHKGLFSRMNYVIENQRLYIKDNADKFESLKVGTEILKIQEIPVKDYLSKYEKYITGDGHNTTFKNYALARRWPTYFTIEKGILDSVKLQIRYQNEIKDLYIHREIKTKEEKKEEKKVITAIKKDETKKTKDYNPVIRSYNRDLQFLAEDSSIAYMKIKTFSGTYSRKFYKDSFAQLEKTKSKVLILDIRDNLGGSLSEINNLYSYFALEKFQFIKDIEVTSRTSMFQANYFSDLPGIYKPAGVLAYPFYLVGTAFSSKKKEGKIYLRNNNLFSIKKPKANSFKGRIYVLINGSSFSASSIISSKLKNDQRALLVGEETGGANDGTVAGRYSTKKLPNSKLHLPIGLMLIQPDIKFTNTEKGVIPDIKIVSSLQDALGKKDPQLKWVLENIKNENK